jgi:hypothetical protein
MSAFVEGVAPSFAMKYFQAHRFSIILFISKFREKLKATVMAWCPDNYSVTHKHLVEIIRMARDETPFLSAMQLRAITMAW